MASEALLHVKLRRFVPRSVQPGPTYRRFLKLVEDVWFFSQTKALHIEVDIDFVCVHTPCCRCI